MPPKAKTEAAGTPAPKHPLVGRIVNIEKGGRTITGVEVLDVDDQFLKLRWDIHVSPQTEVVLVPVGSVVIGLTDER
jgi:hypothetical protein